MLSWMMIEVRPVHPSKAEAPIHLTLFGITVVLHPEINLFVDVSIIALHPPRES